MMYEKGANIAPLHSAEAAIQRAVGRKTVSAQAIHKTLNRHLRGANIAPWYCTIGEKMGSDYRAVILRRAVKSGHVRKVS